MIRQILIVAINITAAPNVSLSYSRVCNTIVILLLILVSLLGQDHIGAVTAGRRWRIRLVRCCSNDITLVHGPLLLYQLCPCQRTRRPNVVRLKITALGANPMVSSLAEADKNVGIVGTGRVPFRVEFPLDQGYRSVGDGVRRGGGHSNFRKRLRYLITTRRNALVKLSPSREPCIVEVRPMKPIPVDGPCGIENYTMSWNSDRLRFLTKACAKPNISRCLLKNTAT